VTAGCAIVLSLIVGCGAASAGHAGSGHGGRSGAGQATASQEFALAASESAKITSLTMVETMTMHGLGLPGAGGGVIPAGSAASGTSGNGSVELHATARMRLKPALLAAIRMKMNLAARSISLDEILTSRAIYLKMPGILPTHAGRPWAKISLASLPNGMNLRKLFQQMQKRNPLTAMGSPSALAKFLVGAKHLRVVGHQTVDGVATTEYAGTLNLRALIAAIPAAAAQRKLVGSAAPAGMPLRVWIDGQHQVRKVAMRMAFRKVSMSFTVNITSINRPVRIVPPPSSQVSVLSHP